MTHGALFRITGYTLPGGHRMDPVDIRAGELVWIKGPNGSGKSTLLRWIQAEVQRHAGQTGSTQAARTDRGPSSSPGEVIFFNVGSLQADEVAYLPQGENLNLGLPLTLRDVLKLAPAMPKTPDTLFHEFAAGVDWTRSWKQASGGEKKKVLLLVFAALASKKLYLLDEPSNHLDARAKLQLGSWIAQRCASGAAIVLVSHESLAALGLEHSSNRREIDLTLVAPRGGEA